MLMNNFKRISYYQIILLLLFTGITAYGQSELRFKYEYNNFPQEIFSKIAITTPDNESCIIYCDTKWKYNFNDKYFFTGKGKYILSVYFESEKYGRDSIKYDFNINGNEIYTEISVDFSFREKLIKQGDKYIEGDKIPNGYIEVIKNYDAPESIEISLNTKIKPNNIYRGPYFNIKNNSSDTLCGEFLPGYFWGRLIKYKNGEFISNLRGSLDFNFANSSPLFPDSSDLALVGSFGYSNKLEPANYIYEVRLAKKFQSSGVREYFEKENFKWWADTKEFYVLKCEFEIKENKEQ